MDSMTSSETSSLASLLIAARWRPTDSSLGTPAWVRKDRAELGRLARSRRVEMKLSQESAARKCGIPQHNISWLERGGSIPADTLDRYLAFLGLVEGTTPCAG